MTDIHMLELVVLWFGALTVWHNYDLRRIQRQFRIDARIMAILWVAAGLTTEQLESTLKADKVEVRTVGNKGGGDNKPSGGNGRMGFLS